MLEPHQLNPLDVEEQQLYFKSLPVNRAPRPISKGGSRHIVEEIHFSHLHLVLSVMTQSTVHDRR